MAAEEGQAECEEAIAARAALRDTLWVASGRSPGSRVGYPGESPSRAERSGC